VELLELCSYCDRLLLVDQFDDYCPNGLQVEAGTEVRHLVTGVTASQALIDAAVQAGAEAILVHHGFFWRGESPCIRGMKGRRIGALMRGGVSLLAYHLPLDAHPELGNNAQLAKILGLDGPRPASNDRGILWRGEMQPPLALAEFAARVGAALDREPLAVAAGDRPIHRLAWCTGAAQGYIEQAAELGVDAYLSGEISEQTVHQARELGLHYVAAGHHATERYGVRALGAHLAERFGIVHRHLDIDNPA
jgi:dinuclear metal center YbgI/SA1388 family protein